MDASTRTMPKIVVQIAHFEKARRGKHIITELRGGRHEQLGSYGKFNGAKCFACAARIAIRHDCIRAEIQKCLDRIRPAFENRGKYVVSSTISRFRGRAEGFSFATDSALRHLFGQKLLAGNGIERRFRKDDVAAWPIEIAE